MSIPEAYVFIAMSLDGYIARSDGDVGWLPTSGAPEDGDFGYGEFMSGIDTIVYGRKTFEKVLSMGFWPYEDERVIVLSSGSPDIPRDKRDQVEVMSLEPGALLEQLERDGSKGVYVDGGVTIQRFLRAGVLDRLIVTIIPVLIGSGIPLFGDLEDDVQLTHQSTRTFTNGLIQCHYRVET